MIARFTLDGSAGLEQHLARVCDDVRAGIQTRVPAAKLNGILLGGGYGRGEGGVLTTSSGDEPYNDLEFYICMRGNPRLNEVLYSSALHELERSLTAQAGLHVELRILCLQKLRRSEVTMFSYDLVMGHRRIEGPDDLLRGCEHHRAADRIPLEEATRLLMNRCSGLLFAQEQLQHQPFTPANADFVYRNMAKAQMAFGDVVLTALGQYHWSCRTRRQRLESLEASQELPWLGEVQQHHRVGVEFKLHPHKSQAPADALVASHSELRELALRLWLWLENRRLGSQFTSARDYALSPVDKCPETAVWHNLLATMRRFGPTSVLSPRAIRYPRERLFTALTLLLWEQATPKDPKLLRQVQRALRTPAENFGDLVLAYHEIWRHFN